MEKGQALQFQPKQIIGLSSMYVNDEFSHLFPDSGDGNSKLHISVKPVKQRKSAPVFKLKPIDNYSQISPHIMSLCTVLDKFQISEAYQGPMCFIPSKSSPKELNEALDDLYNDKDYNKFKNAVDKIPTDNIQTSIMIQIKLVSRLYDSSISLDSFVNNEMDPRLSCLFHWYYGTIAEDKLACAHYLKSLIDLVKTTSQCPISLFFEDFSFDNLLFNFCQVLIKLFHTHPLIQSVVLRLASFSLKRGEEIRNIPIPEEEENDNLDDSSDDFDDLKAISRNKQTESSLSLIKLNDNEISNPLEILVSKANQVVVSFYDSPTMITYKLENGTSGMTPNEFEAWIKSCRFPERKQAVRGQIRNMYSGNVEMTVQPTLNKEEINDMLSKLFIEDVRKRIPKKAEKENQVLLMPILHFVNCVSDEYFGNSAPFPTLLNSEFLCHKAFETRNSNALNSALEYFVSQIPDDIKIAEVNPSMELRQLPTKDTVPTKEMELLMCLTDIALILENRSPLSMLPSPSNLQIEASRKVGILSKKKRIGAIYYLYSNYEFSPYLTFRAAFALGIAMVEVIPNIATRFLFEGLYIFLKNYPMLKKSLWVSSAFFELGNALDHCGKYNYCALCLDNALQLSLNSHLFASKAGNIAKKHEDLQRAIFYFSNAIGLFIDAQLIQEAVYTAQILAKIYSSCAQNIEGIQLLSFMLKDIFIMSTQKDKKLMEHGHQRRASDFRELLRPDSISFIYCSIYLCELLLKTDLIDKAENLLNHIERFYKTPQVTINIVSLREKIAIRRNTFKGISLIQDISKFRGRQYTLIQMPQSPISDPLPSLLRLLAKTYLSKNDPIMAIFWSEAICHTEKHSSIAKENAIGFYFRGLAFQLLVEQADTIAEEFKITKELTPIEQSYGSFKAQTVFDKKMLVSEALASFNFSMILFDRTANPAKCLEAQLSYVETLIQYIMNTGGMKHSSIKSITYGRPSLETISADKKANSFIGTSFESLTISSSNVVEQLQAQCHSIYKLAQTLMDPMTLIRAQICLGLFMQFRKKPKQAETYFDYALTNLQRYFFNGHRFIMRDIGFFKGWQFLKMLSFLIEFLLTFPQDFINQRLILFDMYNDMQSLYTIQHRIVKFNPPIKISATLDVQPSILRLANQKFPDFSNIIEECCGITEDDHKNFISKRWDLLTLFRLNRTNIKNFTQHRLTEDQVYEMNTHLCLQMEQIADEIRKESPPIPSNELPPHSLKSTLFIVNFPSKIVTYIPDNGQIKTIRLKAGKRGEFILESIGDSFEFDSVVFKKSFLEATANLIVSEPCISSHYKYGNSFATNCVKLGTFLFDDIPFLSELEEPIDDIMEDNSTFGDKTTLKFSSRGALSILNVTKRPLVIVAPQALNFMPFELMFPRCTVIRAIGFFQAFAREDTNQIIKRFSVMKWRKDKSKVKMISKIRSCETVRSMLATLGAGEQGDIYVSEFERSFPFPFPLFDPERETEKYTIEYPFCDIYPLKMSVVPLLFKLELPLFVMSYADFAEWPAIIDKLVDEIPTATFLFIPASKMSVAFKEISHIFERHSRRRHYYENNKDDPEAPYNLKLLKNSHQMLATIQKTLIDKLNVPIPIICPFMDFYE